MIKNKNNFDDYYILITIVIEYSKLSMNVMYVDKFGFFYMTDYFN